MDRMLRDKRYSSDAHIGHDGRSKSRSSRSQASGAPARPDGVVILADDLATEGEDFQDYVIVHELLHLRYRDHGKQFKAMMTAFVPSWRELERHSQHSTERQPDAR